MELGEKKRKKKGKKRGRKGNTSSNHWRSHLQSSSEREGERRQPTINLPVRDRVDVMRNLRQRRRWKEGEDEDWKLVASLLNQTRSMMAMNVNGLIQSMEPMMEKDKLEREKSRKMEGSRERKSNVSKLKLKLKLKCR